MRRVRDENVGWLSFRDIGYCETAATLFVALLLRILQIHVTCAVEYFLVSNFCAPTHKMILLLELKTIRRRKQCFQM